MCENHRNLGVSQVERPNPVTSTIFSTRACVRSTTSGGSNLNAVICKIEPPDSNQKPTGIVMAGLPPQSTPSISRFEELPVIVVSSDSRTPSKPVAPVTQTPVRQAEFFQISVRTGTAPNPNKVRKSDKAVAPTGNPSSSTLNPDGTVNTDALLQFIHSVPARGMGRKRRRRR